MLIEATLVAEAGAAEIGALRQRIDRPRELPARARPEALAGRSSRPRSLRVVIAAAIASILAVSAVIVTDRVGSPKGFSAQPVRPTPAVTPSPPPSVAAGGTLRAFASAAEFLRYVRGEALKLAGPYGIGGVSFYGHEVPVRAPAPPMLLPAPAGGSSVGRPFESPSLPFSTTNIQEEGVDEPDIVKTDGRRLVVVSGSKLLLLDVTDGGARLQGSLDVPNGTGVFLAGDRVILFSSRFGAPPAARRAVHVTQRPWTKVTVLSIADPQRIEVVASLDVEGSYVGARLAGGVVRLIVQSGALGPPPVPFGDGSPQSTGRATAGNKRAIRLSVTGDWMPHYVLQGRGKNVTTGHVHDWTKVSRPPDRAGISTLTVLTIDPADPRPDNAVSVIGAGEVVYASLESLYVTSNRLDDVVAVQAGRRPRDLATRIHKFDVRDPKQTRYVGSGQVPGSLLNQFSMSERDGYLRVATTLGFSRMLGNAATSESAVTVLGERGGQLVPVGFVGDLGKGERIYSVRFVGAMGYVVTFRQVDPLHVIDLRDPSRPKLVGELKVPGYSGYLHPIGETLLLGVGRDADERGGPRGLQLSLFDVSDPANPRLLDDRVVGSYGVSEVENDHHSFLYWEPEHLAVVPATISEETGQQMQPFVGALALTISAADGFGEPVRLTHAGRPHADNPMIRRSIVIGSRILTISYAGVLLSDLKTLADRAWLPFRR
jgi:uncharacterized secreted protein with C-terminal beta-propeller domain